MTKPQGPGNARSSRGPAPRSNRVGAAGDVSRDRALGLTYSYEETGEPLMLILSVAGKA